MRLLKTYWRSVGVLLVLVGVTFLFNLPGIVKCHGEVDPGGKSDYSLLQVEQIEKVGLAKSSD